MLIRKIGERSGKHFCKIGIKLGLLSPKIGLRNRYVFETSMAPHQLKCGQMHPQG